MKITLSTIAKVYRAKKGSIEDMQSKGYQLVDNLFVDSSGLGRDDEPALTKRQFEDRLRHLLITNKILYSRIVGIGQFQVRVGLFKK